MNKKLEADLMSIAHAILKLKDKEDVIQIHAQVSLLYEKLSALKFINEHYENKQSKVAITFKQMIQKVKWRNLASSIVLDLA